MTYKRRILVLWSRPSGYMDACFSALIDSGQADVLFVGQEPGTGEAPYNITRLHRKYRAVYLKKPVDFKELVVLADQFQPELILSGGTWHEPAYRKLMRNTGSKVCRVLVMDTQWRGDAKQYIALLGMNLIRPWHYDKAYVAGTRQAVYAALLGFQYKDIKTGLYSCDYPSFSAAAEMIKGENLEKPSFLYAGRLIPVKGIPELLEGYKAYRKRTANPWPLYVCGTGHLEQQVCDAEGVHLLGFVQPSELPATMARHTTLVVPSHAEPWGVVIHEAVSSGMSVICSAACGAGDSFVVDGRNGMVLSKVTAETIAHSLLFLSAKTKNDLIKMSKLSKRLASRNTPEIWASRVLAFQQSGAT